jgi:hypothetical protein
LQGVRHLPKALGLRYVTDLERAIGFPTSAARLVPQLL